MKFETKRKRKKKERRRKKNKRAGWKRSGRKKRKRKKQAKMAKLKIWDKSIGERTGKIWDLKYKINEDLEMKLKKNAATSTLPTTN